MENDIDIGCKREKKLCVWKMQKEENSNSSFSEN
jgi:hypothetical protein